MTSHLRNLIKLSFFIQKSRLYAYILLKELNFRLKRVFPGTLSKMIRFRLIGALSVWYRSGSLTSWSDNNFKNTWRRNFKLNRFVNMDNSKNSAPVCSHSSRDWISEQGLWESLRDVFSRSAISALFDS